MGREQGNRVWGVGCRQQGDGEMGETRETRKMRRNLRFPVASSKAASLEQRITHDK
jgi:hypothetical protein